MQVPSLGQKLWRKLPLILILLSVAVGIALFIARTPRPVSALYVAEIRVTGALDYSSTALLGATVGVEEYIRLIRQARDDPMAGAVILVFDSPGGTVAASYDLFEAVRELSERKTVVAYARNLMTSGAYLAALPAKRIYASPASLVGSVGVYTTVLVAEQLLGKLGVTVYTIKSGSMKDIGSLYREMSEEEVKVMEGIVDEYFQLFKEKVVAYRDSVDPEVFTGRPFAPKEAVAVGLVDGVADYEEALRRARELAGLPPDAPVVELKPRPLTLLDLLLRGASSTRSITVPRLLILAMWPPPEAVVLP
ncbi:MAG: signal peptide peptidase SppA [Thermofilum sp.]|uniref:Signal peptide peptidase SppA n=1 Tax=Thermofilum pendens TaxID=2269 RepID=A0A7C4H0R6_THEPE